MMNLLTDWIVDCGCFPLLFPTPMAANQIKTRGLRLALSGESLGLAVCGESFGLTVCGQGLG